MKLLTIAIMAVTLTGCASLDQGPARAPVIAVCAVDPGHTRQEPEPERPMGEFSQRDIAVYIADLHKWAVRGWKKLQHVREDNADCVARISGTGERDAIR